MTLLQKHGFAFIYHYAPLHYLPFIGRDGRLLSKTELATQGFSDDHFRKRSKTQDRERGFGDYVHLTLHPGPPILLSKLSAGFPHIRLEIPVSDVERMAFDLCRYNVAMTRKLRKAGVGGHLESAENGRYYGDIQVPIAREMADKEAMLTAAQSQGWMIEVLVPGNVTLSDACRVKTYSARDQVLTTEILHRLGRRWRVTPGGGDSYESSTSHARSVDEFVATAMGDFEWKGNGLEFDRI
jgi:hypothetical protein